MAICYVPDSSGWGGTGGLGQAVKLRFKLDHFTGVRFGLFIYATKEVGGSATFTNFRYETKVDGAGEKC